MALSEEEQQLLAQMEAALAADDPKLADMLRGTGTRKVHRRRAAIAGIGFVLGIVALVAGMQFNPSILGPILSVAGFLLMLGAAVIGLSSWRHVNDAEMGEGGDDETPKSPKGNADPNEQVKQFMDKMEERWRRRQGDGL